MIKQKNHRTVVFTYGFEHNILQEVRSTVTVVCYFFNFSWKDHLFIKTIPEWRDFSFKAEFSVRSKMGLYVNIKNSEGGHDLARHFADSPTK